MKNNWQVFLIFIVSINKTICGDCNCENSNNSQNDNLKDNYLHSFAVMNMDHLYYGVPFYGSGDQVYFNYSEDYPCKCEKIPEATNPNENLIKECKTKSNKLKKIKKKKNLKKKQSNINIEDNEIELKKLEEIYKIEKNKPISKLNVNNTKQIKLVPTPPKKIIKKLTVKYSDSGPKQEIVKVKNNAVAKEEVNPYLSDIDKYFSNILEDSRTDFIEALSKTRNK
jgi:hypothetical protein